MSPSLVETVTNYIRNQEHHHRVRNFGEEFIALLRKSGINYDAERLFAARVPSPSETLIPDDRYPSTDVLG